MENRKLYRKDENGNVRVWWMETNGADYRTHSGVLDGSIVVSGWKTSKGKNIGKSNETTPEEQAQLDVESKYRNKQYQGKYFDNIDDIHGKKAQFIIPMLAKTYGDVKITFPGYSQPKLNGIRCIASDDGMQSRGGKPLVSVPHIHDTLSELFSQYPGLVFDGELYNHDLRENLERINSLAKKKKPTAEDLVESLQIEYHIYDIVNDDHSFFDRFYDNHLPDRLNKLIRIHAVETTYVENQEQLDKLYAQYTLDGYEGQIYRPIGDTGYDHKRSSFLIKRKDMKDDEFTIESINEGTGNWAGVAKSVTIRLNDGTTQDSGMRGDMDFARKLLEERDEYVGGDVTINYQNFTMDGKLAFPVAVAFYKGKRNL